MQTSFDYMAIEDSSILCCHNSCEPLATDSSASTPTDCTLLSSATLVQTVAPRLSDSPAARAAPYKNYSNSGSHASPRLWVLDANNQATDASHQNYTCPPATQPPYPIGPPWHVTLRAECRMALRPDRHKYVTLYFRAMRRDAEMHVGQIINHSGNKVKRADLYSPVILDRWTRKLQVKIKAMVKVSLVFKSISARLGLQSTVGLKYCLDGFYGIEAFGDAFGSYGAGICPWMEVCGDGTPLSLKLEDGDNIYLSVATEKMIEAVRRRLEQISDHMAKQAQARDAPKRTSFRPSQGQAQGQGEPPGGGLPKRFSFPEEAGLLDVESGAAPSKRASFTSLPDSPFKRVSLPDGLLKLAPISEGPVLEI